MLSHVAAGVVLCSSALAQDPALPNVAPSAEFASGVRAGFWWADYDRDGLDDAFVVGSGGAARLLRNSGDGSFEDVSLLSGLDGLGAASFAAWNDYDRDGAPDVFVGTQSGPGHLMRNAGDGTFQDVTQFVGLMHSGRHLAAQWFDYDLDGLIDLSVRTDTGEHLYHAISRGHFEAVDLGSVRPGPIIDSSADIVEINTAVQTDSSTPVALDKNNDKPAVYRPNARPPSGLTSVPVRPTRLATAPPLPPPGSYLISACPPRIADSSSGGCLQASSLATLGMLYPLTIDLNVSGAGDVGIGTTTPAAKLDVVGTANISDTLTLNPSGDQALNVNTGSIYKGGLLFAHTNGGLGNTAIGSEALFSVSTGKVNTASGNHALFSNTTGSYNTASGKSALYFNTSGDGNTASGFGALYSNTTGRLNTASGLLALFTNTTGYSNTASGNRALFNNTSGDSNTANGNLALFKNTSGFNNTASGVDALRYNTSGSSNTASGVDALRYNTSGSKNTASGYAALFANTIGDGNTSSGYRSLLQNTSGKYNTASGFQALSSNTTGWTNTASGSGALRGNTTGGGNIAIGLNAGVNITTGDSNIAIGNPSVAGDSATTRIGTSGIQARAFVAGIRGVTTGVANGIPVLVDSNGQLGTVSSSRRFKKDIVDMGAATENLLKLRPVRFRYKQEQTMPDGSEVPMEYGLIAEEVAEIFPDLVVYGDDGKPFTVKYHILSSMLLNELEKLNDKIEAENAAHARDLEELRGRLTALEARASPAADLRDGR